MAKIDLALQRTDGCGTSGSPDPKGAPAADWVIVCTDQTAVYDLLSAARAAL